jgi:NADH:ubiquinone oxidoreductase subunit 4 (subunit M)
MINHGLSTGALFLLVGMLYERYHTRKMADYSGMAARLKVTAVFWVFITMSSIGLPGLNGFVSEFLTILGAFTSTYLGRTFGAFAATGIILGAVYMLHMTARVIWGPLKYPSGHRHEPLPHGAAAYDVKGGAHDSADATEDAVGAQEDQGQAASPHRSATSRHYHADPTGDLTGREMAILIPLAIAVVLLGFFPTPMLDSILGPIQSLRTPVPAAMAASPPPSPSPSPSIVSSPRLDTNAPAAAAAADDVVAADVAVGRKNVNPL